MPGFSDRSTETRHRAGLASLVRFAAHHRTSFIAGASLLTVFLGAGIFRLRIETGILDWLPRRSPNVLAFRKVFENLSGAVNQELVWLELDPEKAERAGVRSITDPASFHAQAELIAYLRARVPEIRGAFGILPLLQLAGGIGSGAGEPAGGLPSTPVELNLRWGMLRAAAGGVVEPLIASDRRGTILSLILEVPPLSARARQAGESLQGALDGYAADRGRRYDLFRDEYLVSAGLASGSAVIDRSLRRDLLRLSPAAALLVIAVLRAALGSWRAVSLVAILLATGIIWTFGLMGWCGNSLNILTIALVPLILGCGIDSALFVAMETAERRAAGLAADDIFTGIGRSSATAVVLTTLTTASGLLVLLLSDSPGMMALGFHSALGMAGLALLSILILPSIALHVPPAAPSRAGPVLGALASSFDRNRTPVLLVYASATLAAMILSGKPVFQLDVVEGNYPAGAPITRSVARMRERCGGAFPEIIIARGDLSSPRAIELLGRIEERIAAPGSLGSRFQPAGVPDLLGLHALLEGKSLPGIGAGAGMRAAAPATAEGVRAAAAKLHADPRWAPLAGMFLDPDLSTGAVLLLGGDAGTDRRSVAAVWRELDDAIAAERRPGDPIEVSFLGYRTMAYLFAEHSLKWIRITAAASLAVVLVLAVLFLKERRAILTVAVLMVTSGFLWFGLLQLAGIYVSIFLLFPLVFAITIGSDYSLHILCRLRADRLAGPSSASRSSAGWTRSVWSATGRAIAMAALTDGLVFLLYSWTGLVSVSQVMVAVALAVASIFLSTLLLVPALALPRDPPRREAV